MSQYKLNMTTYLSTHRLEAPLHFHLTFGTTKAFQTGFHLSAMILSTHLLTHTQLVCFSQEIGISSNTEQSTCLV